MTLARWQIGLAAALALALAGWATAERFGRQRAETENADLGQRHESQTRQLDETVQDRDATAARLAAAEAQRKDLGDRLVSEKLARRNDSDRWLAEKAELLAQEEELDQQIQEQTAELDRRTKQHAGEQTRRIEAEALLAAERDAARIARESWQQERTQSGALARQQAEALKRAGADAEKLAQDLQRARQDLERAQQSARSANDVSAQLDNDLRRTLAERDSAAVSSLQSTQALANAVGQLQVNEANMQALQRALQQSRGEIGQLRAANASLTAQVQQLLKQIAALNAEIARLRQPPPAPPPPPKK